MNIIENILGAVQVAGTLLLSPLLRSGYNRWGTRPDEFRQSLPGDELVPQPQMGYTRAITIAAPPQAVWPWLAQLGQGRGGLYSYDGLENLAGCNIHSTQRILPEHQNLQPGDLIRLGPKGYPCFSVASVEPGRSLVLIGADPKTEIPGVYTEQRPKGYSFATWQFILEPLAEERHAFIRTPAAGLQPGDCLGMAPDRAGRFCHGAQDASRHPTARRKYQYLSHCERSEAI